MHSMHKDSESGQVDGGWPGAANIIEVHFILPIEMEGVALSQTSESERGWMGPIAKPDVSLCPDEI